MSTLAIRVPVRCPRCGRERVNKFPINVIADALLRGSDILLEAGCHQMSWSASAVELEQIRHYLVAQYVTAQRSPW